MPRNHCHAENLPEGDVVFGCYLEVNLSNLSAVVSFIDEQNALTSDWVTLAGAISHQSLRRFPSVVIVVSIEGLGDPAGNKEGAAGEASLPV
jgi:hypothetical protein